jgi:MYXO-CTERM domain-containing protein
MLLPVTGGDAGSGVGIALTAGLILLAIAGFALAVRRRPV